MATKTRRTAESIRRERRSSRNAIAAELDRLQKERQGLLASNAELRTKVDLLMQGRAEYNAKLLAFDVEYAGWDYLDAACDVIGRAEQYRSLLHEFLLTPGAPLELRARAVAAVGKPPLEFGPGTPSVEPRTRVPGRKETKR